MNITEFALLVYNFIYANRWKNFEIFRSKVDVSYGFFKVKGNHISPKRTKHKNKIKWYLNREIVVRSKKTYTWLV